MEEFKVLNVPSCHQGFSCGAHICRRGAQGGRGRDVWMRTEARYMAVVRIVT